MKKVIKASFILLITLASASTLAGWYIPGSACVSDAILNGAAYERTGIINNRVPQNENESSSIQVICSSPVHNNYGVLDIEFHIVNNSENTKNQEISCIGYSFDKLGNVVQRTAFVKQKGVTQYETKLRAKEKDKLSNETPVTVAGICNLPDRSLNGSDVHEPSKLISIKVY